jgi:hypothetical protein
MTATLEMANIGFGLCRSLANIGAGLVFVMGLGEGRLLQPAAE